jgi:hypothetical protein
MHSYSSIWAISQNAYATTAYSTIQDRYNELDVTFAVPPAPSNPSDVDQETLWVGVSSSGAGLLQPELWWFTNSNGTGYWDFYAQWLPPSGPPVNGNVYDASSGDSMEMYLVIDEGASETGGRGDRWYIAVADDSTGEYSYEYVYTGGSDPAVTEADVGVLEVQGINACDGLPNISSPQLLYLNALAQEGTSWNDYVDVRNLVSYYQYPSTAPSPPSCAYTSSTSYVDSLWTVSLDWSP